MLIRFNSLLFNFTQVRHICWKFDRLPAEMHVHNFGCKYLQDHPVHFHPSFHQYSPFSTISQYWNRGKAFWYGCILRKLAIFSQIIYGMIKAFPMKCFSFHHLTNKVFLKKWKNVCDLLPASIFCMFPSGAFHIRWSSSESTSKSTGLWITTSSNIFHRPISGSIQTGSHRVDIIKACLEFFISTNSLLKLLFFFSNRPWTDLFIYWFIYFPQ